MEERFQLGVYRYYKISNKLLGSLGELLSFLHRCEGDLTDKLVLYYAKSTAEDSLRSLRVTIARIKKQYSHASIQGHI